MFGSWISDGGSAFFEGWGGLKHREGHGGIEGWGGD